MKTNITAALLSAVLCAPVSALDVDWNQDPAAQALKALKPGIKAMPPAPPQASSKPAAHAPAPLSFYKGTLRLQEGTREFCFSLSPEKIDQFEGDPDMRPGVFVHQDVPFFREDGKGSCETALNHNGGYIRTCGGLFLLEAPSLSKGDVFTTLSRYDGHTGELIVKPVGRYELTRVGSCGGKDVHTDSRNPNVAFPIADDTLRQVAGMLADQANDESGQVMVGDLLSYSCTVPKDAVKARCHFKYALDRSICWYGFENLTAELSLKDPRDVSNVDRRWSND